VVVVDDSVSRAAQSASGYLGPVVFLREPASNTANLGLIAPDYVLTKPVTLAAIAGLVEGILDPWDPQGFRNGSSGLQALDAHLP
jgi:hypothetical protein